MVKNPLANAGDFSDHGSVLGLGRSLGEGIGNPLQYSYLEILMDREPGSLQSMELGCKRDMTERLNVHTGDINTNRSKINSLYALIPVKEVAFCRAP